jgi:hypothetical protein
MQTLTAAKIANVPFKTTKIKTTKKALAGLTILALIAASAQDVNLLPANKPAAPKLNRFGEMPDYSVKLCAAVAEDLRYRVTVLGQKITPIANGLNVDFETVKMIIQNKTYFNPNYFVPVKYLTKVKPNAALLPALVAPVQTVQPVQPVTTYINSKGAFKAVVLN